jgi:hypothetical protein
MLKVTGFIYRGPHVLPASLDQNLVTNTLDLETTAAWTGDKSPLMEQLRAASIGVRVWSYALSTFMIPTVQQLKDASDFIETVRLLQHGIYVHCAKGVDRTGIVIGAWRVRYGGYTSAEAAKEAIANGMHVVYWPWLIQLWRLK